MIRLDPSTEEWVIVAPNRLRRPHVIQKSQPSKVKKIIQKDCPFCPGNESKTPREILRVPKSDGNGWTVRVVPNKFQVVHGNGNADYTTRGPFFQEMTGVGAHEIFIESPIHDQAFPLMKPSQIEQILLAYRLRFNALGKDPRIKYIQIFKNHGEAAGASLDHPHSQLVAIPVPPMQFRRKFELARNHFKHTGRCLFLDLVQEEIKAKRRIVMETERFVVIHPYASRMPFETWIAPRTLQTSFGTVSDRDIQELALVLKAYLSNLKKVVGSCAYNIVFHTKPFQDEENPYFLWHIQILPRLSFIAGFELGTGISITTISPERSARMVRKVNCQR